MPRYCLPPAHKRRRSGLTAFAAPWPAYVSPYRRLVCPLAETSARLGADVVRYTFIVEDFHFLLLASLLANLSDLYNTTRPGAYHPTSQPAATWLRRFLLLTPPACRPLPRGAPGGVPGGSDRSWPAGCEAGHEQQTAHAGKNVGDDMQAMTGDRRPKGQPEEAGGEDGTHIAE